MKNKKPVVVAIIVIILGGLLIFGLNYINKKGILSGEQTYICTSVNESNNEKEEIVIRYENGLPKELTDTYTINFDSKDETVLNEIEEKISFGLDMMKALDGYQMSGETLDDEAKRVINVAYAQLSSDTTGLYARKNENVNDYLSRLEKNGYNCKAN